jgi:hypothetical protein
VANHPAFGTGVDWRKANTDHYSDLIFVCGPVGPHTPIMELLERFSGSRKVGLDLSMILPTEAWNPFDALIARDGPAVSRPDIVFASRAPKVPVLGLILVEPYRPEYPDRDMQGEARDAARRLVRSRAVVVVEIDTRLDLNTTGLRTPAQVETLIAQMDAVVTTRLHGFVLALKNGVPAVAIDPVAGGAKIRQQAEALGWPHVFTADAVDDSGLEAALAECLSAEGRAVARACRERAIGAMGEIEANLIASLSPRA